MDPTLTRLEQEQLKYMKLIARGNRFDQQILRGCLFGVFSALGTTIGFSVILLIIFQLVSGIRNLPVVNELFTETKIVELLERQLAGIDGVTVSDAVYTDANLGFSFSYPKYLSRKATNKASAQATEYAYYLEGSGPLQVLEVYVKRQPVIEYQGKITQMSYFVREELKFKVAFSGAVIDNFSYDRPVFIYETSINGTDLVFVGVANTSSPRISVEGFKRIISSVNSTR